MRLRLAQYTKDEKNIVASDTGGITERHRWARRLLNDPEKIHPTGRLKHGVLEALVDNAKTHGYELSRREIQHRMTCGRRYQTEAELRTACAQFACWSDLRDAGFPAVEVAEPGEPYDPRNSGDRLTDAVDELKRIMDRPEAHGQLALNLVFLSGITVDNYPPQSSLNDLWKAHEVIKAEVTPELWRAARQSSRDDDERERTLQRLTDAVGGDRSATWEDASCALRALRDE